MSMKELIRDFRLTRAKLGVMLMTALIAFGSSQLSPLFSTAGENSEQVKETTFKPVRELEFDEFTVKDPLAENNTGGMNMGTSIPASFMRGSYNSEMFTPQDSLIFENDSTFTIEDTKRELEKDGEWIKVTKAEIDPEGVTEGGGDFDSEINTDWIWRPYNVEPGWSPYRNGYWRYTNCGWMWISYYHWGWRPYHYGRWWWSPVWGWVWSPGCVFAPAWVVWMYDDEYCGWYPISPRVRWHHHHGWRCHGMRYKVYNWTFCRKKDFVTPITHIIAIDPGKNPEIIKKSKYDGTLSATEVGVVGRGPEVKDVERSAGKKVEREDVTKYGTKNITSREDESKNTRSVTKTNEGGVNNERSGEKEKNREGKRTEEPSIREPEKRVDDRERKSNENEREQKQREEKQREEKQREEKLRDYEKKQQQEKQKEYEQRQREQKQKEDQERKVKERETEKLREQKEQKKREDQQREYERQKEYEKQREQEKKSEYKEPERKTEYKEPEKKHDTYSPPPGRDNGSRNNGSNSKGNENKGNESKGNDSNKSEGKKEGNRN